MIHHYTIYIIYEAYSFFIHRQLHWNFKYFFSKTPHFRSRNFRRPPMTFAGGWRSNIEGIIMYVSVRLFICWKNNVQKYGVDPLGCFEIKLFPPIKMSLYHIRICILYYITTLCQKIAYIFGDTCMIRCF